MKITVSGFKSIAQERSIELTSLSILAGANSSGKSSFMQALLLLKQTMESPYDPGPLLLDGPNVRLTDAEQIRTRVKGAETEVFSIQVEDADKSSFTLFFELGKDEITLKETHTSDSHLFNNRILHLRKDMSSEEIADEFASYGLGLIDTKTLHWEIERTRCSLIIANYDKRDRTLKPIVIGDISPDPPSLLHIPGLRGTPERTYRTAAADTNFPGQFEPYIASLIHHWQTTPEKQHLHLRLQAWLQKLGLSGALSAKRLDQSRLQVQVSRLSRSQAGEDDLVNIADVGFGVSQVLPVLVALLAGEENQIVYIEQPELHLHPRAQVALATCIAEAVLERKIKLVLETHSELLLRAIQTLVAQKQLPAGLVSLHWFSQDQETGQCNISSSVLDEYGTFGDWPQDFADVSLQTEGAYLDAVEAAQAEAGGAA